MHRRGVGAGAIAKKKLAEASISYLLYLYFLWSWISTYELLLSIYLGQVQRKRDGYCGGPDCPGNWF